MNAIKTILLALSFLAATSSFAFDPDFAAIEDPTLINRFPLGTITTRETADQALKELRSAKSKLKELAEFSKRRCNENFFVNSCIDDVRKAELRQSRRLQAIEAEARRVVREDETRKEAARQQQRDAKAAQPPKQVKKTEPRKPTTSQQKAQENKETYAKRMRSLEQRNAQAQQKAAEEAENRAAYEQKKIELEKRRAERAKALEKRAQKKAKQQSSNQNNGTAAK